MLNLVEWCRYVVFDDDLAHLYLAKTEAVNAYIKKKNENKNQDDSEEDPDDMDISEVFKGSLNKISLKNEVLVWKLIEKTVDESLAKYPTTIEEDIAILDKDEAENNALGFQIRNCILYRKGEKVVLHFLKNCAKKAYSLCKMTQKEAKKEINQWKGMEHCDAYFKNIICTLLD